VTAVLVDTDVLVEYLRGQEAAADYLETREGLLHVSAVTVAELFAGARSDEEGRLETFLEAFSVRSVTAGVAMRAGSFRREYGDSHGTGLADALIAATAAEASLPLATFNTRHFPMLERVDRPYER